MFFKNDDLGSTFANIFFTIIVELIILCCGIIVCIYVWSLAPLLWTGVLMLTVFNIELIYLRIIGLIFLESTILLLGFIATLIFKSYAILLITPFVMVLAFIVYIFYFFFLKE
jgi:hypothetical protein